MITPALFYWISLAGAEWLRGEQPQELSRSFFILVGDVGKTGRVCLCAGTSHWPGAHNQNKTKKTQ
jgi:hypothetical protein